MLVQIPLSAAQKFNLQRRAAEYKLTPKQILLHPFELALKRRWSILKEKVDTW